MNSLMREAHGTCTSCTWDQRKHVSEAVQSRTPKQDSPVMYNRSWFVSFQYLCEAGGRAAYRPSVDLIKHVEEELRLEKNGTLLGRGIGIFGSHSAKQAFQSVTKTDKRQAMATRARRDGEEDPKESAVG